jgi:DNA-binding transcriptional LysR family regulator
MELRHLAAFTAVAEEDSFTAAGKRLCMVQSAVSAAVRTLERELDVVLFDRTTHYVRLTSAGRLLLPEARRTLAAAAAARDMINQAHGGLRGTVRLGISQWHEGFSVPKLIAEFRAKHPRVEIELHRGDSTSHAVALRKGRLDLAFLGVEPDSVPGLSLTPLVQDRMRFVTSLDHHLAGRAGVNLAATADEPFADTPPTWAVRICNDRAFRAAGLGRRVVFEVGDLMTVLEFVRYGLAVAIVPSWVLAAVPGVIAMPVRAGAPVICLSLATAAERELSAPSLALLSIARQLAHGAHA